MRVPLELGETGHDRAHELAAGGAEVEAQASLRQDAHLPTVEVIERLHEVLGTAAPTRQLGDEDGVDLQNSQFASASRPSRRPSAKDLFTLGTAAARYRARYWNEREFATVQELRTLAKQAGMTMPTMAVSWVLSNPAITSPIIGATASAQLAESLAAAEKGPLPEDLKTKLDSITQVWRAVDAVR
jgi:Aldo/keto reductase family